MKGIRYQIDAHLKVPWNVKGDSSCRVNNVKDGEVQAKCKYSRPENNNKGWEQGGTRAKPFNNTRSFQ